jgi:hypothetical protein
MSGFVDLGNIALHPREKHKKDVIRTNGSRRRNKSANSNLKTWLTQGLKIGSINIRGLTYLKLYMLLAQCELDVISV